MTKNSTRQVVRWIATAAVTVATLAAVAGLGAEPPPVVTITAHRFDFSPAEVTLERGRPVTLRLTSQDVTHGFYSKALGLDELIEPGKVLDVSLTPAESGRFTVICDHFCGAGHGGMKMTLVVK
jgi:cytochrome c oxidase subunit 2